MYYASVAPVVIKNHIITGVSGDDLDRPGFLEAHDPETGALQWRWSVVPKPGEPGSETWPNAEAMAHGGGMTWISPTYDPDLNLLYVGTGNPQPVMAAKAREGANLFTDIDRGVECGYRQTGVVFPTFSARHARLGCGGNAGAVRRRDRWQATQVAGAGEPQWLVLCAGPRNGKELRQRSVYENELDERCGCEGATDSRSGQGAADCRRAGFAECGRRGELASADVQPRHRIVLCQRHPVVCHLLHF